MDIPRWVLRNKHYRVSTTLAIIISLFIFVISLTIITTLMIFYVAEINSAIATFGFIGLIVTIIVVLALLRDAIMTRRELEAMDKKYIKLHNSYILLWDDYKILHEKYQIAKLEEQRVLSNQTLSMTSNVRPSTSPSTPPA
jgi:hypothetical protein